jgi:protein-disulfide isomerase
MVLVLFVEPYCALCYESFLDAKQYVQNHKNIKIIIQHFPIYGKYSYLTTCALLAAHQYGQYTPYKKRLHEKSEKDIPTYEELLGIAKELGIQPKAFEAKLRSIEVRDIVRESLSLVKALKIDATPTYVLLHPKLKQPKIIVGLEKISEVIKPDTL